MSQFQTPQTQSQLPQFQTPQQPQLYQLPEISASKPAILNANSFEGMIPERQTCGTILATIPLLLNILGLKGIIIGLINILSASPPQTGLLSVLMCLKIIVAVSLIYFNAKILSDKYYLAGKPSYKAFWPHALITISSVLFAVIRIFGLRDDELTPVENVIGLIIDLILTGLSYLIYSQNDFGGSGCLCLKPFVLVKAPVVPTYIHPGYGYPAQQIVYPTIGRPIPQQQPQVPMYQAQKQIV